MPPVTNPLAVWRSGLEAKLSGVRTTEPFGDVLRASGHDQDPRPAIEAYIYALDHPPPDYILLNARIHCQPSRGARLMWLVEWMSEKAGRAQMERRQQRKR